MDMSRKYELMTPPRIRPAVQPLKYVAFAPLAVPARTLNVVEDVDAARSV
jgi:hypothetical protein